MIEIIKIIATLCLMSQPQVSVSTSPQAQCHEYYAHCLGSMPSKSLLSDHLLYCISNRRRVEATVGLLQIKQCK